MMTKNPTFSVKAVGDLDIVITREFDAPASMVFDAYTKPELVKKWLTGPPGNTMPICEIDLRVGGKYRYVWRNDASGQEMTSRGVYVEIARPERIVCDEQFENWPQITHGTLTLKEKNGKTFLTNTLHYDDAKTREQVLKSGMERGVEASYDRMEEMLKGGGGR